MRLILLTRLAKAFLNQPYGIKSHDSGALEQAFISNGLSSYNR